MGKKLFETEKDEQLFAGNVAGDCWKMPKFTINKQVSGRYYFTDKRIAFLASGLFGTESVSWDCLGRMSSGAGQRRNGQAKKCGREAISALTMRRIEYGIQKQRTEN